MPYPPYDQVQEAVKRLNQIRMDRWLHHELFSLQWWFLVATFVIPLTVWWKLVNKRRFMEIALFTVVTAIVITVLDAIGTELSFWGYPYQLIPFFPMQLEYDYSGLPVVYALLYQYLPKWKPFLIAMVLLAGIYSFAAEPFFMWLNIYRPFVWSTFYSFPIYIAIGAFSKWLIEMMIKTEVKFH